MNSRYGFKVCYLHILFSIDDQLNWVKKKERVSGRS